MQKVQERKGCVDKGQEMNKAKKYKLDKHYSGNSSKTFWNYINSFKKEEDLHDLVYELGCNLQNFEANTLNTIRMLREHYENRKSVPGSTNGRSTPFEGVRGGSNPSPGSKPR